MAGAIRGNDGVARNGATNAIEQLVGFTIDIAATTMNPKACGDDWERTLLGTKKASGTITVNRDPTATEQLAVVAGAEMDIRMYPYGTGAGSDYYSPESQTPATLAIVSEGHSLEVDGIVQTTYNWEGPIAVETLP